MFDWIVYALIGLAVLVVALAGLSKNRYVKRRLLVSLILALLPLAIRAALTLMARLMGLAALPGEGALESASYLLGGLSFIIALVAVGLNPFRGQGVSERWPSIIQDALVLAGFLAIAFAVAGDKLLALGLASSFVVGFALRDTLGNLFSGLALQSEKPFHVGDWVSVAKREGRVEGKVLEVTWRATKIRTKSGNFIIVPNGVISQDSITNYSKPSPVIRLERLVAMPYGVPPNQFKQVVVEAANDIPDIMKSPKPDVLTHEYGDFAIQYRCRFWVNDFGRSEPITDQFTTLLYYRLKRAGLPLAFPVREVRIIEQRTQQLDRLVDPRLGFVERVDLFAALQPEIKQRIAESMEPVTLAAGEPVIRQGEAGDSMFFIYIGRVRIVLEQEGAVQELAMLDSGQFFGEMALLTGEPRSASAFAEGDVEAFVLRKDNFREVLVEHPEVAEQISKLMGQRKELLQETSAGMASRKVSPQVVQRNFLSRIQNFFGLV